VRGHFQPVGWEVIGTDYQVAHPKGETFIPRRARAGFAGEMDRIRPVYKGKRMAGSEKYREFQRGETQFTSSGSSARKEWSAQVAMILLELSQWIGQCFYPHE
jgi:hypothetical protein